MNFKQRFEPFLVLLEARYLPLLLLALPQSYTVAIWLTEANKGKTLAEVFAIIGAAAFEFSYVGAIAWAENRTKGGWVWGTAIAALIFSVLVSVRVYWAAEGGLSFLHAGFPIVAFAYTMCMHTAISKAGDRESAATNLAESPADSGGSKEDFQPPVDLVELLKETEPVLVGASARGLPVAHNQVASVQPANTQRATIDKDAEKKKHLEEIALVVSLRNKKKSWDAIAQAVGKSKRTVQNWYADANAEKAVQ